MTSALDTVLASILGIDPVPEKLDARDLEAWDSANHLRIILALEELHGITFTIDEIETATNRTALATLLAQKQ